jgi:hypothetical protein
MHLVIWIIMCRYHCEYGSNDYSPNMHGHMPNIMLGKSSEKNKNNHKIANKGHKGPQVSMKRWGDLHRKGGCCSFTLKRSYIHPTIIEIWGATFQHVNKEGFDVHGLVKSGLRLAFLIHVSKDIRAFVLEHLWLGLSMSQVMNKHKVRVKEMIKRNGELSRDLFLNE